jgi:hypothetical protein
MPDNWPVLTVRQPWSWALLHGKTVENRTWEMKHRGPLWLHAGARSRWDPDGEASPLVRDAWCAGWGAGKLAHLNRRTDEMAFGAVTALVEVTGCHHARDCVGPAWVRDAFPHVLCSPWAAWDQFHIVFEDVRELPHPVPCKGALGLWRLPEDVEKAVREQLSEVPR